MRRALAAAAMAALLPACPHNLDALRGRDAGPDRAVLDAPTVDVPAVDVPVVVDAPTVDRPTRPPNMGTCPAGRFTELQPSESGLVAAMTDDSTVDAGVPPAGATLAGCTPDMTPPPTRLYRYVVRQGARLTASTNTGLCGDYDTRVFAFRSCEGADAASNSLGCADDIMDPQLLCNSCTGATSSLNCSILRSALDVDVVPGDVVFFAVNGYMGTTGAYRFWVGENAATIEPLPTMLPGAVTAVNRCPCQANARRITALNYPGGTDGATDTIPAPLNAGSLVLGARSFAGGMVSGVTAQLRFSGVRINPDPACIGTVIKGTFDLYVGNSVLTSFSVRTPLVAPTTITVPFTSFAPVSVPMSSGTRLQLTLRSVEPAGCLSFELDRAGPNVVTLYGP